MSIKPETLAEIDDLCDRIHNAAMCVKFCVRANDPDAVRWTTHIGELRNRLYELTLLVQP